MNKEIERKFLASKFKEMDNLPHYDIIQGYIHSGDGKVVRVRTFGEKAYITVKYRISKLSRGEFEYEIPYNDAVKMIDNCCDGRVLFKTRYIYLYEGKKWEIDVFHKKNDGIILAEIELKDENELFSIPPFVIKEVTGDMNYSNNRMAEK